MKRLLELLSEVMTNAVTDFTFRLHGYDAETAAEILRACSNMGISDEKILVELVERGLRDDVLR